MDFDEYKELTQKTAIYPEAARNAVRAAQVSTGATLEKWLGLAYVTGKLNGEAGEVAEEVFKAMRDDQCDITVDRLIKIRSELGDLLYYAACIAVITGMSLEEIAAENIEKLQSRKERGVLKGSGSNR
jgi:NTP pyrophosphatase (non-canonical NTP hydrolase)